MTALPPPMQDAARPSTPPKIPVLPGEPGAATGVGVGAGAGAGAGAGGAAGPEGAPAPAQGPPGLDGLSTETGFPFDPEAILRQTIPIVGMSLAMLVVLVIGWPLARAYARRLDRRTELGMVSAAQLEPQIRQLQESIDTMAVELERISEAQRFQAKLLADRSQPLPVEPKRA